MLKSPRGWAPFSGLNFRKLTLKVMFALLEDLLISSRMIITVSIITALLLLLLLYHVTISITLIKTSRGILFRRGGRRSGLEEAGAHLR